MRFNMNYLKPLTNSSLNNLLLPSIRICFSHFLISTLFYQDNRLNGDWANIDVLLEIGSYI